MAALLERVRRNDPPGIRSLVRAGADVNARDRNGFMALHVACVCGHRSVVELLLQAGADANARDAFGFAALHMAAQEGRRDVVELLVRSGADANAVDGRGLPALHRALEDRRLDVAELLLERGAAVDARDADGRTALHRAARGGLRDGVEILLRRGADVRARDAAGDAPLHVATRWGKRKVAHLLLDCGAVAVVSNGEGRTPIDEALSAAVQDVPLLCRLLLPSGALVHLAERGREVHEARRKRIGRGLERGWRRPELLGNLADALAGVHASGCVEGTGAMLRLVLRRLDALSAEDAGAGSPPPGSADVHEEVGELARTLVTGVRQALEEDAEEGDDGWKRRFGVSYLERRRRRGLALGRALRNAEFRSDLADGLADASFFLLHPRRATRRLAAAALRLDALAAEGPGVPALNDDASRM